MQFMSAEQVYQSIVLTGGGGLLGAALGESLAARGLPFASLEHGDFDITRSQDVQRLFAEYHPTLLLNCAAYTRVDACEQQPQLADAINGHAVGLLAGQASQFGTRLVHFSSDFVFSGGLRRSCRPDDRPEPLSAYGRSKLLGEQQLQQLGGAPWLIVRTSGLFGRHGYCFPKTILDRCRQGRCLEIVDDQITAPTYAADLAEATLQLIGADATGIWHATNAGSASWFEFAQAIVREFGIDCQLVPVSTAQWLAGHPGAAIRPAYSVLDCSALAALGRPMRPWKDALIGYRTAMQSTVCA